MSKEIICLVKGLLFLSTKNYLDGVNDFSEGQFSCESVAMIDNRLSLFKVGHI